ncbi:MAG: PhoH family protein [Ruminococcaceae bacterium]|nr:PhoH family protein [Oscillospiraceae bacterium]
MAERIILSDTFEMTTKIFGPYDENIKVIEDAFKVRITNKDSEKTAGNAICISGEPEDIQMAAEVIAYLKKLSVLEDNISKNRVEYAVSMAAGGQSDELSMLDGDCICVTNKGKPIKAKTVGQKRYVEKIKNNTVVFGVGPAGTGKTFLAVAMAVTALKNKQISRIILTRPAVEAGEKLGYLPGDLQNKIDPYLRPLYDALFEMLGSDNYARYLEKGTIEIAPLAYMRGRTLDDSFIILDEAQNTTPEQMKMFLTRLGFGSKAVVTGDVTQTDLPRGQKSGLRQAIGILDGIDDIAIHQFTDKDVVRHRLVQKIILAYEKFEKSNIPAEEKKPRSSEVKKIKFKRK